MKARDPQALRVKVLSALLLLGVFAAGIAAGIGAERWLRPAPHRRTPPSPVFRPLPLESLDLDERQRESAREIGARHEPELDAIRRRIAPEVRAIHARMEAELRAILTREQRERHDRLKDELDRRLPD